MPNVTKGHWFSNFPDTVFEGMLNQRVHQPLGAPQGCSFGLLDLLCKQKYIWLNNEGHQKGVTNDLWYTFCSCQLDFSEWTMQMYDLVLAHIVNTCVRQTPNDTGDNLNSCRLPHGADENTQLPHSMPSNSQRLTKTAVAFKLIYPSKGTQDMTNNWLNCF